MTGTAMQAPPPTRFGMLLREFRLAAGLSQEALAELATISADAVSALERGTHQAPQRETLELLIRALKLDAEQQRSIEAAVARASKPRKAASREGYPNNLPHPADSFFGRDRDIETVAVHIQADRLVTLTGAGGVGKTRLALETGLRLLNGFADGVWFVDLARISDPGLVPSAAAAPFGLGESGGRPLAENLTVALHRKHALLIFDNCEHVLESAAQLIQTILARCPNIHILATSRQSLSVPGEQLYRVASLELEPAMAFFADRAHRASRSFALSDDNRETVARIVQRLDGIALAIELAAARLTMLTVEQIEERLSERFRILSSGSQVTLPRQQTMRATIDWSHDLLSPEERSLFCRFAIFAGGFSLEAAGAICSDEAIDSWRVFEVLASLVDKSLVVSEPTGSAQRYHLLDSMRAYALEKLPGDDIPRVSRRHAEYYTGIAEGAQAEFELKSTMAWACSFDPELQNFRSALDWALTSRNAEELGVRLLTSLQEFWVLEGLTIEALRYTRRALELVEELPLPLRAALWLTLARMQHEYRMAPREMLDAAVRACDLYEQLEAPRELAMALRERGVSHVQLGAFSEAENDFQRSLDIYRELNDTRMMARTLGNLGRLRQLEGAFEDARTMLLEVMQLSSGIGDDRTATVMSIIIAEIDFALGDAQKAADRARKNLANHLILRKSSDLRAGQESNLAAYLFALGRDDEARSMALSAIREANYTYAAVPMQHLAAIIAPRDPNRAATLLGYVERVFAETSFSREKTELYTLQRLTSALRENLDESEIVRFGELGAALTEDQAFKLARRRLAS
jgi:predicted ATPase/DNA-binding XRE family transcriptional regulator